MYFSLENVSFAGRLPVFDRHRLLHRVHVGRINIYLHPQRLYKRRVYRTNFSFVVERNSGTRVLFNRYRVLPNHLSLLFDFHRFYNNYKRFLRGVIHCVTLLRLLCTSVNFLLTIYLRTNSPARSKSTSVSSCSKDVECVLPRVNSSHVPANDRRRISL